MNKAVCVDASFVIALITAEKYTIPATRHWKTWLEDDVRFLAPALLGYEVTSALYQKMVQKEIDSEGSQSALQQFLAMDIDFIHMPNLHVKASVLAEQFNRPNAYDAHYLALAEHFACTFWTADERLYNMVKGKFQWMKWIEDSE
jgi:predicted nucleic acid-binding protein